MTHYLECEACFFIFFLFYGISSFLIHVCSFISYHFKETIYKLEDNEELSVEEDNEDLPVEEGNEELSNDGVLLTREEVLNEEKINNIGLKRRRK